VRCLRAEDIAECIVRRGSCCLMSASLMNAETRKDEVLIGEKVPHFL